MTFTRYASPQSMESFTKIYFYLLVCVARIDQLMRKCVECPALETSYILFAIFHSPIWQKYLHEITSRWQEDKRNLLASL